MAKNSFSDKTPPLAIPHRTQDYLKAIASLAVLDVARSVKPKDIADRLSVSPAAITDMVRKLESEGYVTSAPYKGVFLTEKGRNLGANMIRHHRLWEVFLHDELGLSWDQVHDEAERLEHACSDALIDKIEEKLGFPRFDPHGNPIPDKLGRIATIAQEHVLSQANIGLSYVVTRVSQLDQEDLAWLGQMKLTINSVITAVGRVQKDGAWVLKLEGDAVIMITADMAAVIYVCEMPLPLLET